MGDVAELDDALFGSLLGRVEQVGIHKVLGTACGTLVDDEILCPDEAGLDTADVDQDAVRPAFLERDTADRREQVDANGRIPELHHDLRFQEIIRSQSDRPHPEVIEGGDESLGVVSFDEDPHVEVLGRSGMSVRSERVAADDQKANITTSAALDELDEVACQQLHRSIPDLVQSPSRVVPVATGPANTQPTSRRDRTADAWSPQRRSFPPRQGTGTARLPVGVLAEVARTLAAPTPSTKPQYPLVVPLVEEQFSVQGCPPEDGGAWSPRREAGKRRSRTKSYAPKMGRIGSRKLVAAAFLILLSGFAFQANPAPFGNRSQLTYERAKVRLTDYGRFILLDDNPTPVPESCTYEGGIDAVISTNEEGLYFVTVSPYQSPAGALCPGGALYGWTLLIELARTPSRGLLHLPDALPQQKDDG